MYKAIFRFCIVATLLISNYVFAEEGVAYMGAGYHMGTYDESGFDEYNPTGLKLKAGKYIAENVAIEGHLIFGIGSDEKTYNIPGSIIGNPVELELEIKNAISVFVKGDMPLSNTANIYGLLGFTKAKAEVTATGPGGSISGSDDDSGLSYGFGAEVGFGNNMYVSGEYVIYISESDYDYSGFNIGISKEF